MRRGIGKALRVGVSKRAVALIATNRFRRHEVSVLAEQRCADSALDSIGGAVASLLGSSGCNGWPVSFVIADDLARLWQVTPPPGAARMADLEAACAFRFQALYGEPPSAWRIAADFDPVLPFLAAALPRQLLAQLEQAASAQRMVTIETVPQFVAGHNRWRKWVRPDAWYGLVHDGVLSVGAAGVVRPIAVPLDANAVWLAGQLEREALRLNVAAPGHLFASGEVPAAWTDGTLCTALGEQTGWSPAVRLAATGSAA